MDKLFEHAASIIKESGKSTLGFGSLIVLAVATTGVLMFKDARDEHVKLYAFFGLIGAFLLFLLVLLRSTKRVARKLGTSDVAFEMPVGGIAGSVIHQPVQAKRNSGLVGCVIGLVVFGIMGMFLIIVLGGAMMDLNWDKALQSNSGAPHSGGSGGSNQESISGWISVGDAALIMGTSGEVTVTVYSTNPGDGFGQDQFYSNEVIHTESSSDGFGNPVTLVTVNADLVKARVANE